MSKYIAITGGIGSGKSTASAMIENMGFPVFSCDTIYQEILQDPEYVKKIGETFDGVVKDGAIDKRALGKIIYADREARKRLETLVHPRIMETLFSKMQNSGAQFVFAEVPLLFEGGYEKHFDYVLVIVRDIAKRIEAMKRRDGVDEETAKRKIAAQFDYDNPNHQRIWAQVNITKIDNDTTPSELRQKLCEYLDTLKNERIVKQYL